MKHSNFIHLALLAFLLSACATAVPSSPTPHTAVSPLKVEPSLVVSESILPNRVIEVGQFVLSVGGKGRLAFASNAAGGYQIGVIDLARGELRWLTEPINSGDAEPRWSPDGQSILFVSGRDPEAGFVIYEMKSDGSSQRPLTLLPGRQTINLGSSFSPDGKRIAFHTNRDGNMEIYVMNRDGSELRNLTNHPANDITPVWSADGSRIFFASDRQGNEYQIFAISLEGGEAELVFAERGRWNYTLDLSPDGERLAFLTRPALVGNPQVGVYNLRTREFKIVTNGFDAHNYPRWMGNDALVFAHRTADTLPWVIRVLDLRTGQSQVLLQTKTNASVVDPAWTPTE